MSELTVLGSCGAWPEPGLACAGFLLVHEGFKVVLDLGYGAASRLFGHCPGGRVDAVVVTHEHPDHCADVSALGRARAYGLPDEPRIPLHCTPGTVRRLEAMEPRPHPTTIFDVHELGPPREVGPFRMATFLLPHHVPNYGIRLTAPGLTVAYTGDSGPSPIIAELARDADLLIADATLQGPSPDETPRLVSTAGEAGYWAERGGARRLLLTHFWPGSDRGISVAEARKEFSGEVLAAAEGTHLRLAG
ncbi:MBL fold metallo-hydrolase [Amycolatopsis keratiniphila]|uniref:MBL fold metallo-hydrolase n=1 Tax=Amycolatopsis keratiniphila subsp. keratiniphila TaxID=227715 RepID=A0A1W2LGY9_9PSEU|nr:MBL fold metallo-hydrolase [Amycolatopsis keratiniphila]ONF62131.1 MBL fold metallo-hydrolase [Amycolatopsis keratiniphila subsp. keratiniphila]